MADQAVTAVTSELASRAIEKWSKHETADEKLQRLEMLLIRIHAAVEASEKHALENNTWLLRWRGKLKDAASDGDQVLASFRERAREAQAQAQASNDTDHHQQQEGSSAAAATTAPPTTTTSVGASALSFTRNALSAMVQGIRSATEMLLPSDEDTKRLNAALEKLQLLSPDIGEFIRVVQLEVSAKAEQRPPENTEEINARERMNSKRVLRQEEPQESAKRLKNTIDEPGNRYSWSPTPAEKMGLCVSGINKEAASVLTTTARETWKNEPVGMQLRRIEMFSFLRRAFGAICKAVEQADSRDLNDREWLAAWAAILREAKERGGAVLSAVDAARTGATNAGSGVELPARFHQEENDELCRFVGSMQSLADDVGHFGVLASLCPSR